MKYKLFVSANQKEFREERLAIKDLINKHATLRQCFDVFLFEDLPAKGKSPVLTYPKRLEGRHATRNKTICDIFHETMDMERFGTGIGKMKKLMKEHSLSSPDLSEEGDFFVVRFYGPGEKILDLVPNIPEHRQTDLKKLGLNERQIEALRLMVNEKRSITNELYQDINKVSRRTALRDLRGLVKSGQVKTEGIGKGTKYNA